MPLFHFINKYFGLLTVNYSRGGDDLYCHTQQLFNAMIAVPGLV